MLALSGQFPLAKIGRRAAFIKSDEIEARPAPPVQPPEARLLKQGSEALTGGVAPASLSHEAVEDLDFALARSAAFGKTPFENLLVRPAGDHSLAQVRVLDAEKSEAMPV